MDSSVQCHYFCHFGHMSYDCFARLYQIMFGLQNKSLTSREPKLGYPLVHHFLQVHKHLAPKDGISKLGDECFKWFPLSSSRRAKGKLEWSKKAKSF